MNGKKSLTETGIIFVVVVALIRLLFELRVISWFAPYVAVSVAILLVYSALLHAHLRHERVDYFDRLSQDYKRSGMLFVVTTLLVIPPFLIGNHFWQEWVFRQALIPRWPPGFGSTLVFQLFLVAIPEEVFFRGWLQNRLNHVFAKQWRVLGVSIGWGWILAAALFALAHSVIFYQWWHFAIFFPALLFGWLREKTGTVTAPILFHCVSNLAVWWIGLSYI